MGNGATVPSETQFGAVVLLLTPNGSDPPAQITVQYKTGGGRASVHDSLRGIPDTLSALVAGLRDTGACGLYGTCGWQPAWLPLFRRGRPAASSDVLDRVAQFYADRLTVPVLRYLAERGFPETFVRQRRIGYAPISSSRDLLVREIRSTTRSNGAQLFQQAIEAGLVVQDKAGAVRDFFASETAGYILFPNVVHGRVVDLQGRAYPVAEHVKSSEFGPAPARCGAERSPGLSSPGWLRATLGAADFRAANVVQRTRPGKSDLGLLSRVTVDADGSKSRRLCYETCLSRPLPYLAHRGSPL